MLLNADFLACDPRAKTLRNLGLRSQILADCNPNGKRIRAVVAQPALSEVEWACRVRDHRKDWTSVRSRYGCLYGGNRTPCGNRDFLITLYATTKTTPKN